MASDYHWTVRVADWQPEGRPQPPYGPTAVEVLRSCPLRRCFELSRGYERHLSFAGRIGTAFHQTVESLLRRPLHGTLPSEAVQEAARRFDAFLEAQRQQAGVRPRERGLPQDEDRIQRAREAVMAEAIQHSPVPSAGRGVSAGVSVEMEVEVQSADGLFRGYVDRAEHRPDGTHIIDYKSALRPDVPERYERQLHMYAVMWAETRGQWPVAAELCYPMLGRTIEVPVDPATCIRTVQEAREIVERLQSSHNLASLATPGDVCQVCEFRPWCQPFWDWQRREACPSAAFDRAHLGLEGPIVSVERTGTLVAVSLRWRQAIVRLVARPQRFPHLDGVKPGDVIRALDFKIQGVLTEPRALPEDYSEVFIVLRASLY